MRLVFAGLFILFGLLGVIVFVNRMYPDVSGSILGYILGATIAVLILAAYFLFNERSPWVKRKGLLTYSRREELISETYHARRALEVSDPDGIDVWYLVELEDGKVLCLWDNLPGGPLGFDPAHPDVRRFPCTEFTVSRHAIDKVPMEVVCAGEVLKPLTIELPEQSAEWRAAFLPRDGEEFPNKSFDEVKADLLGASRGFGKW